MHYYEVWVASPKYHGTKALTYSYPERLISKAIVTVPLQRQTVPALVVKQIPKPSFKTKEIIRVLSPTPLPPQLYELLVWMTQYYPASIGVLMSLVLPNTLSQRNRYRPLDSPPQRRAQSLPPLTEEQDQAVKRIRKSHQDSILLHGNTGTGKTRVYLELAKEMLSNDKSVMILTPEIGLTPQLAMACSAAFPGRTVIVHSDLSPARRRNIWLSILESRDPLIVIGARSALFSPLNQIGVIIVDEFHEPSYKQDQSPYYQSARVAAKLAKLHSAKLILGSATPPVADYYAFQQKNLPIVRMESLAMKNTLPKPQVKVIDLKKREEFRASHWLSDSLLGAIRHAYQRGEQSLLFLNRRGTARLILCQACAWQALCPHCDVSLTYHSDTHNMQCHICGFSQKTPMICPDCSANDIIFRIIGTKALVAELERFFPSAKIRRFDSDNTKVERLEQQYETIKDGGADILVGTQVLGKGLDLPKLSVLGVVLADTGLSFPDYTAEERTFQLLTQVMGRVNRGHLSGEVYVQTYQPDNPLLSAAIHQDYEQFFELQLNERKLYAFPPFRFTLKLVCSRIRQSAAEQASRRLAGNLRDTFTNIEIIGPTPSFVEKAQNRYRWQIIIKSTQRSDLVAIIKDLPANWSYDIDPVNLL